MPAGLQELPRPIFSKCYTVNVIVGAQGMLGEDEQLESREGFSGASGIGDIVI